MRTAPAAGLVLGALLLQGGAAYAGEGSSLRGLKPPHNPAQTAAARVSGPAADPLLAYSPRTALLGGTVEGGHADHGLLQYDYALHKPLVARAVSTMDDQLGPPLDPLPRYTLHSYTRRALPGGLSIGFGLRQSEYNLGTSSRYALSAEHAFGSFRGAYTVYSNRVNGSAAGSAQRFQLSYNYGERNTVGLSYTTGRDIASIGVGLVGLQLTEMRDWSLSGRHWLSPNWALTYDVLAPEQTTPFRRQGLRFGVTRSF